MDDQEFTKEMTILWQNLDVNTRHKLGLIIRKYFDEGERGDNLIAKMQEAI